MRDGGVYMYQGIMLEIPQDIVYSLKLPDDQIQKQLLTELSVSLYEKNILSFGKARELAKMTIWEFNDELGIRKINRHYTEINLEEDITFAKKNHK